MKRLSSIVVLVLLAHVFAAAGVRVGFQELMIQNERNPKVGAAAKALAEQLNLPRTIYLADGTLIDALGIEDGKPVYAVITNRLHPMEGGMVLFFDELTSRFSMQGARINPTSPILNEQSWGSRRGSAEASGFLLVPDWTSDKVMAFDAATGDLLDTAFIHSSPTLLASPKEARLSPQGTITVSDQIADLVQNFDTSGTYRNIYAPAGGVNTNLLDNMRGHAYRPSNNNLIVTVGSGANQNSVAEFTAAGAYVGQFIAAGAGSLNSPFAILYRASDLLVTASSSPTGVHRYDHNGASLGQWAAITNFPQQIIQMANGDIAIANFSGTGQTGIRIHKPDGAFIRLLSGVTGNRGVYQLPSGRFLTTNGAGIHEIDTSGALVRTIATGTNMQYINYIPRTLVDVREQGMIPQQVALAQNYPNPFNPSTTIRYSLPAATHVRMVLYDLLGKEVAVLLDETREAGDHAVRVSGEKLASGVYFYSIQANGAVFTRRMIVLK